MDPFDPIEATQTNRSQFRPSSSTNSSTNIEPVDDDASAYSIPQGTPSRPLWDPLTALEIRPPSQETCCAALNNDHQPCGFRLKREQRDDVRYLVQAMAKKKPQDALVDLPELAEKTLCDTHRGFEAWVRRNQKKWANVITSMTPRNHTTGRGDTLRSQHITAQDTPSRSSGLRGAMADADDGDLVEPSNSTISFRRRLGVEFELVRVTAQLTKVERNEESLRRRLDRLENHLRINGREQDLFIKSEPDTQSASSNPKLSMHPSSTSSELEEEADHLSSAPNLSSPRSTTPTCAIYHDIFEKTVTEHIQLLRNQVLDYIKSMPQYSTVLASFSESSAGFRYDHDGSSSQTMGNKQTTGLTKRKNQLQRSQGKRRHGDGSDGDDDDKTSPKKLKGLTTLSTLERRLACPYFQRIPPGLRLSEACRGPGFKTVHRLK
jgi:hypothetical protein